MMINFWDEGGERNHTGNPYYLKRLIHLQYAYFLFIKQKKGRKDFKWYVAFVLWFTKKNTNK